jgi:hypothetical protein
MKNPSRSEQTAGSSARGLATWAGLPVIVVVCAGCSHLTSQVGSVLPEKPATVTVGESHLSDVLRVLGPPSKISAAAGGYAMLYEHSAVEEIQLGFNVDAPVLMWFKFVGAKSWLEHQAWVLTFDGLDVLRGWGDEHWHKALGKGGGAQILVTVSSLVDSSQVRRPAPQHTWGMSSLERLPKVLNTASSLDSGAAGLEQTLAPTAVGQRALEMTPAPTKAEKKKQKK